MGLEVVIKSPKLWCLRYGIVGSKGLKPLV